MEILQTNRSVLFFICREKKDAFMDENDILRGFFDPANELRDFVNDSRSASPTPSLVSNK